MQQELQAIVDDVRAIAKRQNWPDILEIVDGAHQTSSGVLIAAPDDCDSSDFQKWLKETTPGTPVTFEPLSTLTQKPVLALTYDRVVIVFTSGILIKGEAASIVQTSILTRPAASYAIVMSGARNIQSDDDLAMIERGIRRLFLSYILPDIPHQQDISQLLQANNIYLWDREMPNVGLQDRLQQDSALLSRWLTEAGSKMIHTELNRRYVRFLLQQTEVALTNAQRKSAQTIGDQPGRFLAASKEIGTLRHGIRQLMQKRIRSVKNTVAASLETLQEELLRNLQQEVLRQYRQRYRNINLEPYVMQGLRRWQEEREKKLFLDTVRDMKNDINELVQNIDWVWTLVNEELALGPVKRSYPNTLLDLLGHHTLQTAATANQASDLLLPANNRRAGFRRSLVPPATGFAAGVGGWLLGGGVLLTASMTIIGALAAVTFSNRYQEQQQTERLAQIEAQCKPIIYNAMSQVIKKATENVQQYGDGAQEVLDHTLEEVEMHLSAKVRKTMPLSISPEPLANELALLQSCYQRLTIIMQKHED